MDWDIRPRRAADLQVSEVTDGYVVSRPDGDRVHFLNPTAAFILESCDGILAAGELPDLVAVAFQLETAPIADVETCLEALLREGLLAAAASPLYPRG